MYNPKSTSPTMSLNQKNILICFVLKKYLPKEMIQEIIKFCNCILLSYKPLYVFLSNLILLGRRMSKYKDDPIYTCALEYQNAGDVKYFDQIEYLNTCYLKLKNIPDEINLLRNLTYLDLSNNNLADLPKTLSHMMMLRTLYLENNKFQKIPIVRYNMKYNVRFYLAGNPLKELPRTLREQIKSYPKNFSWID